MKKLLFTSILSIFLMVACGAPKADRDMLEQIEHLALENQDSALALLDSMHQHPADKEFNARAIVARAEVMYQTSQLLEPDSIMDIAIAYYRLKEKNPRRARAYFLSGYQHELRQEYAEAIIDYLNAEHTATINADTLSLGLIYRAIGDAFSELEDYSSSLEFYKKSLKMFETAKASKYIDYAKLDLARAYYNAFDNDSCLILLNDSLILNRDAKSQFIRLRGLAYGNKYDFDSALYYYKILLNEYPQYLSVQDWRNLGHNSFHLGKINEAKNFNDSLKAHDPADRWLEHLIYISEGDYKKSYEILYDEFTYSNAYFIRLSKNNMGKIILSHYKLQLNNISKEHKNLKNKAIYTCVFTALLLIIIYLIFKQYQSKQLESKRAFQEIIHNLKECIGKQANEIALLNKQNTKNKSNIFLSLPSDFNALEILCNNYYTYNESPEMQKKTYKQTMEIIKKMQQGGNHIKNLISFINDKTNNLFTNFCAENPNTTEIEQRLFLFILLGFSPITISVLLNITVNQVYAKKTYLKSKIKKNNCKYADDFLHYF